MPTGTENNNRPARIFTPQYLKILETVFQATKAFSGAFAEIQTLDGITHNAKAFSVKTCGTPVVIGTYNKGANVAFGTGTGKSSRFGDRTEVIYTDTDVPYSYDLVIHEGIDQVTVNNNLDEAVAERLLLQSEAQARRMNARNGEFLSGCASLTKTLADYKEDLIIALFNTLSKYFVDKEVNAPVTAYMEADLYNAIVDMPSVSTGKGSSVSVDSNGLLKYKNFTLVETPSQYFASDEIAYFTPDGIAIPFVGVEIARTIESEDFAGVALQAFAKGGSFMLDDNKAAVVKVKKSVAGGGP